MKQLDMKTKLYLIIGILCTLVLLIWSFFYTQTLKRLTDNTQNYVTHVSNRLIETLENTFLSLEHVSISMSINQDVKSFLKEDNALLYHEKSQAVSDLLESICRPDGLVEHILIYNKDGIFRRFRGHMGNTGADRIGNLIERNRMSQHIAVTLEGVPYIGYITSIYEGSNLLGHLVFLIPSETLQEMFQSYDPSQALNMGLAAMDTLIVSSDNRMNGKTLSQLTDKDRISTIRNIGLTPFQIWISDSSQVIGKTQDSFALASLVTIFLLLSSLIFFWHFLHSRFLSPMFNIIQNAKDIGGNTGGDYLALTGQEYFDPLVEQINSMVERLQENRQAIYDLDLKRQKAVIISLKKQINAHFTVNSLNVIKRLNETGQQHKVSEMSDGLSFLLRYVNDPEEYIDGLDEIFILEKYIDIMQIRYPDTFTVEFLVDEKIDSLRLPRMLVQPLVENAIVHGLCPAGKKGHLKITVEISDRTVAFHVSDDGVGMTSEKLESLRQTISQASFISWDEMGLEHIAIPNIQKRIISLFGLDYGLTLDSAEKKGTHITLMFPVTYITCQTDGIG